MDDVSKDTLKKANDALESSFDDFLKENSVARRIPILDSMTAHYGEGTNLPFANYFFGTEGKNIQNAAQCTIARGSSGQKLNLENQFWWKQIPHLMSIRLKRISMHSRAMKNIVMAVAVRILILFGVEIHFCVLRMMRGRTLDEKIL